MLKIYYLTIIALVIFSTLQSHVYAESWNTQQVIGTYLNSNPPKPNQTFNLQYKVINGTFQNFTTDKYGQFVMFVKSNNHGVMELQIPQNYPYSNIASENPRAIIFVNGIDILQKYTLAKSECFFDYSIPFSGNSVITFSFLASPEKLPYDGNIVPNYCLSQSIPEFPFSIPILVLGLISFIILFRVKSIKSY